MSLIVSLTSTSIRLDISRYTLLSLLSQSLKPDRIVVCLSKEPYLIDEGVSQLPAWLKDMVESSLIEVKWVENTGPYRKLIPVYEEAEDSDAIVTCDDDVIYGIHWLKELVKTSRDYPNTVVCGIARKPVTNFLGRTQSYINWPLVSPGANSPNLLPTGVGGVLYRKQLLDREMMRSKAYKEVTPRQDDLWFNLARLKVGCNVVVSENAYKYIHTIDSPGALCATNVSIRQYKNFRLTNSYISRILAKVFGYMGMSICGNDLALEKLNTWTRQHNTRRT